MCTWIYRAIERYIWSAQRWQRADINTRVSQRCFPDQGGEEVQSSSRSWCYERNWERSWQHGCNLLLLEVCTHWKQCVSVRQEHQAGTGQTQEDCECTHAHVDGGTHMLYRLAHACSGWRTGYKVLFLLFFSISDDQCKQKRYSV